MLAERSLVWWKQMCLDQMGSSLHESDLAGRVTQVEPTWQRQESQRQTWEFMKNIKNHLHLLAVQLLASVVTHWFHPHPSETQRFRAAERTVWNITWKKGDRSGEFGNIKDWSVHGVQQWWMTVGSFPMRKKKASKYPRMHESKCRVLEGASMTHDLRAKRSNLD